MGTSKGKGGVGGAERCAMFLHPSTEHGAVFLPPCFAQSPRPTALVEQSLSRHSP